MHTRHIINQTRSTTLASHARVADSPLARLVGLLGRPDFGIDEGLILQPCTSIHMFGMRFAIDALYLDEEGTVLHAIPALQPWRIGPVDMRAHSVIELPQGTLARTTTQAGDHIILT